MPGILITRPLAATTILAARLTALGYTPYCEPLLTIVPTDVPAPDFSTCEAVILTSANAVAALQATGWSESAWLRLPCYCVGPSTAASAAALGFSDVRAGETAGSGADLAEFILASHTSPQRLLHIAGQHTDPAVSERLTAAGHHVAVWPVYAAQPISALTPPTVAALRAGRIDAVLVFSTRTAASLVERLTGQGLTPCCAALTAIGLSEAVTAALQPLNWRDLQAAPVPTEDAMMALLQNRLPLLPTAG